jgi:hypothetical protein
MPFNNMTDMRGADVALLSFWLGLPGAVRYAIVILTILGAGWTARGTFTEFLGLEARVEKLEQYHALQDEKDAKQEALLLFLSCRAVEMDKSRSPASCVHYVRQYDTLYELLTK